MSPFDNDIRAKAADRQVMDDEMRQFLARGGVIQRPASGPHKPVSMRAYSEAARARRNSP